MAFLAKFFGSSGAVSGGSADIRRLYGQCRAEEFGFTQTEFAEMLEDVLRRSFPEGWIGREQEAFFRELRLDDLVLARACARGVERAWDRFLVLYREKLYRAAAAIAGQESVARELADSLYADLFGMRVEQGERYSKLASYTGRGSLEGWLRAVLAQEYVNRYRNQRKLVSFDEEREVPVRQVAEQELSSAEQSRVEQATDAALAALSPEERFLLAAYYLDERTLAEIGRTLGLHESTVSRRLERTTLQLRKDIIRQLCRSGMSKREAEEILKLDVRDFQMDVRNRLTQEGRGESFPH